MAGEEDEQLIKKSGESAVVTTLNTEKTFQSELPTEILLQHRGPATDNAVLAAPASSSHSNTPSMWDGFMTLFGGSSSRKHGHVSLDDYEIKGRTQYGTFGSFKENTPNRNTI